MRSPSPPGLAALAAALLTAPAAAQEGPQPRLILGIGGGVHTGHGLWEIANQPLAIADPYPAGTLAYDSLRLVRTTSPGLVITFSGTYFPSSYVGLYGDVTFLDMGMENSCSPVAPYNLAVDTAHANMQVCENLHGSVSGNSTLVVALGVALRSAPRGLFSPYVRAGLGYAIHSSSTTALSGGYVSNGQQLSRQIVADEDPKGGSPAILLAAGLTQSIGSGYQLRLEVRDDFFALERITGPANSLGQAPTDTGWYHHFSLVIGLDIIFDRKRARRY